MTETIVYSRRKRKDTWGKNNAMQIKDDLRTIVDWIRIKNMREIGYGLGFNYDDKPKKNEETIEMRPMKNTRPIKRITYEDRE